MTLHKEIKQLLEHLQSSEMEGLGDIYLTGSVCCGLHKFNIANMCDDDRFSFSVNFDKIDSVLVSVQCGASFRVSSYGELVAILGGHAKAMVEDYVYYMGNLPKNAQHEDTPETEIANVIKFVGTIGAFCPTSFNDVDEMYDGHKDGYESLGLTPGHFGLF